MTPKRFDERLVRIVARSVVLFALWISSYRVRVSYAVLRVFSKAGVLISERCEQLKLGGSGGRGKTLTPWKRQSRHGQRVYAFRRWSGERSVSCERPVGVVTWRARDHHRDVSRSSEHTSFVRGFMFYLYVIPMIFRVISYRLLVRTYESKALPSSPSRRSASCRRFGCCYSQCCARCVFCASS